ncbi:MAG TPA: DUF2779 domain-containing protein [Caldisericia bacterium]|nr:DUF2779 domain-containing protein [Caldisericia bacterium]
MKKRYLTKSRFKLGLECPTKLFYTGKSEYANQRLEDSFLLALADGGFQVGSLAKCYFPGGHDIITLDHDESISETNRLLKQDHVTIYEAAIRTKDLFIRADILVKNRNHLSLYEVKSKSFNPEEEDPFYNKNGTIKSDWLSYLYDVAFQKYVIKKALPKYTVSAHLMMADKSVVCPTDGLNQKFRLVKDSNGRKSVYISDSLTHADLSPEILCRVNVDAECEQIYNGEGVGINPSMCFTEMVNTFASHYVSDTKFQSQISTICSKCEFHTTDGDERLGFLSGKKECWRANLGWNNKDMKHPTVLDVWSLAKGKKEELIEHRIIKMRDLSVDDVNPKSDNKPGVSASQRRWLQVEKVKNRDNSLWLDRENLRQEMNSWVFPLHFIDFETAMVAIPFNAGRTPYEGIAFQFSHHVIHKDNTIEHVGEYLNTERGVFPNYDFVRALKSQLEGDKGTIFRYSHHENTFLVMIYKQLKSDKREIEDRDELCEFIKSITRSTNKHEEQWEGERSMVDMCEIVKRFYYDPATHGSNSIKQVLPSILNRSPLLQSKYSKPIYGSSDGIRSLNFKDWQWIKYENGIVVDPYSLLPQMFQDIPEKEMHKLLSDDNQLNDGGAAMTAYARLQFEDMSDYEFEEIRKALLKYCELDTMAMVMIYEGWKDLLKNQTD